MATLGDVALRAGVSAATVSRVLNHPAKVSTGIRERVMRAMDELGYVRDGAARALASRQSLTIGHVVPTLGIGIFASGVAALQRRLDEYGYQLLVAASDYDEAKEARQVRALIERGVDGIALVGQRHLPEIYQLLRARQLPYVNTYQFDRQSPHPTIGFDNRIGTFALTQHLIDLGHREFGIVTAAPSLNDRIAARLRGILDCLDAHDIPASARHIFEVAGQTIVEGRSRNERAPRRASRADCDLLHHRHARNRCAVRVPGARHPRAAGRLGRGLLRSGDCRRSSIRR